MEGYEVDRILLDKQMVEKVSTTIKFTDSLEELQKILEDSTKMKAQNERTQVFIVGYKNKSNERLRLLTEVFESLDIAAIDDIRTLQGKCRENGVNSIFSQKL